MAVTDLTGTKWILNDTPTTTYNELYNINFISNGFDWTKLFLSGVIGYGWAGHSSYGMYHIAYMPAHTVSIPFFANQNYLLYYSETENIDWKSIQLTYSSDKHPDGLSDYQYISLKPNTRYALCPYRTDGRWVAGPAIGHQNDGSDSNFLVVSKFSTSTFNMSDFLSTIKYPNYTSTLTPVSSSYVSNSDTSHSIVTAYTTPSAGFTATEFKTITITGGIDATNTTLISWLEANATQILPTSFKHYYKNTTLIGTGTYKFRPYTVIQPQLSTPVNVSADGTTVSWDEVENATSYEILADGTSIGEVENESSSDATVTITNTSTRYVANVGTSYGGGGMANSDIGTVGTNSTEIFTIPKGTVIYISATTGMGYDSFVSTSITGNITEESSGGFLAKMIINGDGTITGYANNAD